VRQHLRSCFANQRPLPEVGWELPDEKGRACAEAELVWTEQKIAVLLPEGEEFRSTFEVAGWKVYALAELDNDNMPLLTALSGE